MWVARCAELAAGRGARYALDLGAPPCPGVSPACYAHLAAFVRGAPEWQQQSLWRRVGEAAAARVGVKPVWLSTAGAGVAWVHVRLDDRPKYYGYDAYRRAPRLGS